MQFQEYLSIVLLGDHADQHVPLFTLKVLLSVSAALPGLRKPLVRRVALVVVAPSFPLHALVLSSARRRAAWNVLALEREVLVALWHALQR